MRVARDGSQLVRLHDFVELLSDIVVTGFFYGDDKSMPSMQPHDQYFFFPNNSFIN